jgi:aryl-alcohol dehydrogenase-like predicted oxidoreductase
VRTVRMGAHGLEVSRVVLGTAQAAGTWGTIDASAARAAIRYAYDVGITTFDTAQVYGDAERLLGQALNVPLRDERERIVISTKGGIAPRTDRPRRGDAAFLREGIQQSLRRLGVDYVDLFQVHWPDPLTSADQTAESLHALLAEGLARHVGVSNYDVDQLLELNALIPVTAVQLPYNLLDRSVEDTLLPACRAAGIGVLAYSPLAAGLLTGRLTPRSRFPADDWRSGSADFRGDRLAVHIAVVDRLAAVARRLDLSLAQLAVAWLLAQPGVHSAIVGSLSARNISEAVAATGAGLSGADLTEVSAAVAGALAPGIATPEGTA